MTGNLKKKKLVLLGGLRYLIPVIKRAHQLGIYVITCDNVPDNIAHKFSDEQWEISIFSMDEILEKCKKRKIDGIMSFAVDPGVITAAYISEKMQLPGIPIRAAKILQNKILFREFLQANNFNVPKIIRIDDLLSLDDKLEHISFPVIVKPADSAGSKGVSRVDSPKDLEKAVSSAFKYSITGTAILEEFIALKGFQSDSDCFSIDNKLVFASFSSQYFDSQAENEYVPIAFAWPSKFSYNTKNEFQKELQRLISLLGIGTSLYNVELRISDRDIPYIMEVSPRGGGNRISELIEKAYGIDLISASINAALGNNIEVDFDRDFEGYWGEAILFSKKDGTFDSVQISPAVENNFLVELDLWVEKGSRVKALNGANNTIGTVVLQFPSEEVQDYHMSNINEWLQIIIK